MKLTHCNLLVILFLIQFTANSQAIQNSGFENWFVKQFYAEPNQFASTNFASYLTTGVANVIKTTDAHSGSFAVKLETIPSSEGNVAGALFIGALGDGYVAGGTPYNERPDSVTGFVKYNVLDQDTANIILLFKKFGAPLGICFIQFTGSKNNYARFSAPVQWLIPIIPPDSLATVITSSSIFSAPLAGSTITVDDIGLIDANNPYPNNGFENWTEYSSEEPENWFTSNIFNLSVGSTSVIKTNDSYDGNFAIRIENTITLWGDTLGSITNGTFGENGPIGGMTLDSIPEIISGYYKYEPVGPDTAIVKMTLYHFNQNTGISEILEDKIIKLPPASEYTYFEIESNYFSLPEPDTLNIAFGSSNFNDDGAFVGLGSTLYIDALEITYKPHIVSVENHTAQDKVRFYPNPASETIYFEISDATKESIEVTFTDLRGTVFYNGKYNSSFGQKNGIDVSYLAPGLYFYNLNLKDQNYNGKFMVK
jgi:hypothetical protein